MRHRHRRLFCERRFFRFVHVKMDTESDHPVVANRTVLNVHSRRVVAKGEATLCLVSIVEGFSRGHIMINDAATLTDANESNAICLLYPIDCLSVVVEVFTKVRRGITIGHFPRGGGRIVVTYHVTERECDFPLVSGVMN